jgi:predicted methyltransferase
LLVDHSAKPGTGQTQTGTLHRIDEQFARADFESRGMRAVAESAILRNPGDAREQRSFDSPVAGKTDRFVVVFKKDPVSRTR